MKSIVKLFALIITAALVTACSKDDSAPGQTVFEKSTDWVSPVNQSCRDVYDIDLRKGTRLSIQVSEISGSSDAQLAIYSPKSLIGGMNMLTGNTNELSCGGQNVPESVVDVQIVEDGVHQFSISRNWGSSTGTTGDYKLTIIASERFYNIVEAVDNEGYISGGSECK